MADQKNKKYIRFQLAFSLMLVLWTAQLHFAGSLLVSWNPVTQNGVAGYTVHYGTSSGNYAQTIDSGNVSSCRLQNLIEGQKYFIVVSAYDTSRTEGQLSPESSGLVLKSSQATVSALDTTSANISWQSNKPAAGWVEYWLGNSYRMTTPVCSGLTATHTTALTNLTPGVSYSYRACSKDEGGSTSCTQAQTLHTQGGAIWINAGGGTAGCFLADSGFSGGSTLQSANPVDLSATAKPAPLSVYQSSRTGASFRYSFSKLLPSKSYLVRLHFAETEWTTVGQRAFRVYINSKRVLNNFDILLSAGGANKAVVRQFTAEADSLGKIQIQFSRGATDVPKVNGIEVIPDMTAKLAINAGGLATSPFSADMGASGGVTESTSSSIGTDKIFKGAPQRVYKTWRFDNSGFSYTLSGLAAGNYYLVRLHFAESRWTGPGQRLFQVAVNGEPALVDYDIFAEAGGAKRAHTRDFYARADSAGRILLQFSRGAVDVPLVQGMEAYPLGAPLIAVNAGGGQAGAFLADAGFAGGTVSVSGTPVDMSPVLAPAPEAVYQSQREGDFNYLISNLTPSAAYVVRLHFAENKWAGPGQRQFDAAINGKTVLRNFDIFRAAGAVGKAVVREILAIADSNGQLRINFSNGAADQPMVCGIELLN